MTINLLSLICGIGIGMVVSLICIVVYAYIDFYVKKSYISGYQKGQEIQEQLTLIENGLVTIESVVMDMRLDNAELYADGKPITKERRNDCYS